MAYSGGEVVFYRLIIRSKTGNVADDDVQKVEGNVKTFVVHTKRTVRPGDIYGKLYT